MLVLTCSPRAILLKCGAPVGYLAISYITVRSCNQAGCFRDESPQLVVCFSYRLNAAYDESGATNNNILHKAHSPQPGSLQPCYHGTGSRGNTAEDAQCGRCADDLCDPRNSGALVRETDMNNESPIGFGDAPRMWFRRETIPCAPGKGYCSNYGNT